MNSGLNIDVEEMTNAFVTYGLYLGAIFQIACVAAGIFIPDVPDEGEEVVDWYPKLYIESEDEEDSSETSSPQDSPQKPIQKGKGKTEKKKRR